MKKKRSKKPAEYLIQSVLEDLKKSSDDSAVIESEDLNNETVLKENIDKTTVLGEDYSDHSESEFLVDQNSPFHELQEKILPKAEDENRTKAASTQLNLDPESEKSDQTHSQVESNKTQVANLRKRQSSSGDVQAKVSFGGGKGKKSSFEGQFSQAENLKMAQQRILDLEKEVERLRKENEVLSSASEISRQKMEDLVTQVYQLEKQKVELQEVNESELQIFKDGLTAKDSEILRLRNKVEELESRLSNDLRKVRVRERELENRLELSKAEKAALLRAKDEAILELKRKTENLESEIEGYQNKIIELGQKLELNHDQFARTVRALRLALTNLEVSDGTSPSITLAPYKKAE